MNVKGKPFGLPVNVDWPAFRIYQVELTNFCNLRCSYCPQPSMHRQMGYMSENVLHAVLGWILRSGSKRIVLHHFGEPLLHPQLKERLSQVIRTKLEIQISTNGVLLDKMWDELASLHYPISIMLSIHLWATSEVDYFRALEDYQCRAAETNLSILPAYNIVDGRFFFHAWASGEKNDLDVTQCPFVRHNAAAILWNGDIVNCCVDHDGVTATQNILDDDASSHRSGPWSACATCDVGKNIVSEDWDNVA